MVNLLTFMETVSVGENLLHELFQRLKSMETVSVGENLSHELFQRLTSMETVSVGENLSHELFQSSTRRQLMTLVIEGVSNKSINFLWCFATIMVKWNIVFCKSCYFRNDISVLNF